MSNNTFNAPIHIHMESEMNRVAILEMMEKLYDLEDLMCELIDTLYGDTECEDDDEAEETDAEDHGAPAADGIPMILCIADDLPEDFAPEEAAAIAKEALSHILNFKPAKEEHHG